MLPLLAGLAGLALMGNPFRAKRRNPKKRRRNPGQPYEYTVERVHISRIAPGDVVQCTDGHHRTVGLSDLKIGGLFGRSLFGDSYRAGRLPVERVIIKRAKCRNPGKRKGGKAVTPSGAGARLAKWRWHHNPSDLLAKVKHAAQLWRTGRFQTLEDAVDAAGLPMRTYIVERVQDEVDDTAERARRAGSNPSRYARLDAKAVAKSRLNIRSGGRPHTLLPAVIAQSAAGRARRTLTYGQRSRLSKRIAFEYLKAIKAGKRRRSR